jgi:AAA15 family ATPase/GTPase
MLSSISIENFRCFNHLQVKGFRNINLIGGQNNSGKTALLEALLLSFFPTHVSISILRQFRNENDILIKNATDRVWNYFFFNQNKSIPIKINSTFYNEQNSHLEMSCTKDIENILKTITSTLGNGKEKISDLIYSKFSDILLLNVKGNVGSNDYDYFLLPDKEDSNIGTIGKTPPTMFTVPPLLHSFLRLSDNDLSNLYSLTKENKKITVLHSILKILDNRIVGSELAAFGGEPVIRLILNDEQSFPLALFGDAVRKIAELILIVLNTTNKIILIDEIENGIHFTKHRDLWTKLFEIVGDDIQIFATSHSAEMIKAFNDVAYQTAFEKNAMYFELSRTIKTHQIIANPMDMESLNYEILTNNSYRGE